jgi:Rhodopirellula transposase DDE domain
MTVGGKNRVPTFANDHDFAPEATLTPVGIFLPQFNDLYLYFVHSSVTADCLVDILEQWWQAVKGRFTHVQKLVVNADNGPENHSRRTQFMFRLVNWSQTEQMSIQLAYYPPYHSKYNPVEKTFGWLEQHWNGALLDSVETVLNFASSLEFRGNRPVVQLISKIYKTGVKLTQTEMTELEQQFQRLPGLEKWFVEIPVSSA